MKKVLLAVLALVAVNAFAFNGTIGRSTALKYDKSVDANSVEKQFINVKNSHSVALLAGQAVVPDLSADDGASVIISATSGLAPLCVMAEACAVNDLCSCQKYGIMDAALFDVTAASAVAGKRFYMSTNNAGYVSARASEDGSEAPAGIFYDAAAASGSVQVFIQL